MSSKVMLARTSQVARQVLPTSVQRPFTSTSRHAPPEPNRSLGDEYVKKASEEHDNKALPQAPESNKSDSTPKKRPITKEDAEFLAEYSRPNYSLGVS